MTTTIPMRATTTRTSGAARQGISIDVAHRSRICRSATTPLRKLSQIRAAAESSQ